MTISYLIRKKIFGRRWKLKKLRKYKGLNRLKLEEIKKLEEIDNSLSKNYVDAHICISWTSMIVLTFLLFYNWSKISRKL